MSVTVEYCVWTQVSRSIPWLPTPPGLPQPGRGLVVGQWHLPQLQRDFSESFRRVLTFLKTTENGEGGKDNTALSEPLSQRPLLPGALPSPLISPKLTTVSHRRGPGATCGKVCTGGFRGDGPPTAQHRQVFSKSPTWSGLTEQQSRWPPAHRKCVH